MLTATWKREYYILLLSLLMTGQKGRHNKNSRIKVQVFDFVSRMYCNKFQDRGYKLHHLSLNKLGKHVETLDRSNAISVIYNHIYHTFSLEV